VILRRKAMLARYMLSSCVRLSVRLSLCPLHIWNANRNSYALYRMALFPVTLSDPILTTPEPPHFRHFVSPVISVRSGVDREFEFGR